MNKFFTKLRVNFPAFSGIPGRLGFLTATIIGLSASTASAAQQDGALRVELTTAYNFIVDSNVETPATYAPRAAYISARIWNDGTVPITDVNAYIGNRIDNTPGIYPSRPHPGITGPLPGGEFAFTHEGGALGTSDASRLLGTIPPGGYLPVYWLVSYPNLDENGNTVTGGIKPDDDLFLFYDIWATGQEGATTRNVDVRRRVHMRNCISAMANKIFPNTANKVPQTYQDILQKYQPEWNNIPLDGTPGTSLVTEGIWYDLGNVGQGFDNDGNLVPDQNAWLQPVGDPSLFDPASFRLQRTYALIVVKLKSGGELVYDVTDQLYFTDIPDNTGVIGLVRYDYLPLQPNATSSTTPYQMAASGFDNEKFNGDFGLGFSISSPDTELTLDKTVDLNVANPGDPLAYTIDFTNPGAVDVGNPVGGVPLVVMDSIPAGTTYVAGTAATGNTLPAGVGSYEIFYSVDNRITWTATEPATASDVTDIQWWLSDTFQSGASGQVTFSVQIENPYPFGGSPVLNVAGLAFGNTLPFLEDDAVTLLQGTLNISGTVYEDIGTGAGGSFGDGILNGTEPGIPSVAVSLYYDSNNNGVVDSADILIQTLNTTGTGTYQFTGLPDGNYVVQVDRLDPDIPTGYTNTSPEEIDVTLAGVDSTGNNFGFAPTLLVTKSGTLTAYPGDPVQYTIGVSNQYTATRQKIVTRYAGDASTPTQVNKAWQPLPFLPGNVTGAPDGIVISTNFDDASEELTTTTYGATPVPAGTITRVELVLRARTTGFAVNDNSRLDVSVTGTSLTTQNPLSILATSLANANLVDFTYDITTSKATWDAADFSTIAVDLIAKKAGNPGAVLLELDSVAFVITQTETSTLAVVPLTDTYNADELEFVSATPTPDATSVVGSVGTLSWNNIGPIAPGGSASVTVNFIAKPLPGVNSIITTDTATVTGAEFENGDPANDGEASADTEILPTASIGDTIFVDANRSGSQDLSEPGIDGVTVELLDSGNNVIATDVTDANGNYLFENLRPGTYTVRVVTNTGPLVGWTLSADPDLDGEPFDPLNPDPLGDSQTTRTLAGGDFFAGADFGYFPPGYSLSGILWIDFNGDGIVDENEIGLQFVTVNLYDSADNLIGTTITDSEGAYTFAGLSNGDYYTSADVTTLPAGLTQTFEADVTINNQNLVTIAGADEVDVNFGYQYSGTNSLSGTVGIDDPSLDGLLNGTNPSGVAVGEVAYGGVTVYVYTWNDAGTIGVIDPGETTLLASTTTNANGDYSFVGLPNADYYIVSLNAPFDNLLLTTTAASVGHPATQVVVSSDSQGYTTGAYEVVPVAQTIENMDFAFQSAVEYDFGDLPDSYRTLQASNGARHIVPDPGNPTLYLGQDVSTEPEGQPASGANLDTFDDGVDVVGIWSNGPDGGSLQIDVVGTGWLVGFIDFNNNGNFNELGDLVVNQAVTTGTYSVNFDIPAGSIADQGTTTFYSRFRVLPQAPNFPELAFQGEASNGEVEDYQWDFHSIGDFVWIDANGNGIQDGGETGLIGVGVELLDASNNAVLDGNGNPITTTTDNNGFYIFTGLPAGTYRVRFDLPEGYVFSPQGEGSNQALDSDPDPDTAITADVVLNSGQSNLDVDAGVYLQSCPDLWTDWQAKWDADLAGQTGLLQNPDGDRYNNLIEYAFCLPPNSGVRKPFCLAPSITAIGGIDGVYSRTAIGGAKDVTYWLEWTAELASPTTWTGSVILDATNTTVTNNGNGTETVRIPDLETLTGLTGAGFVRIRVDLDNTVDQETAHTDVLGWVETEFGTCCSTYCNPFLECAVFTGTVDSVSGQNLVLTTSASGFDLGTLLQLDVDYYIEVETGDFAGHRFDVTAGGVESLTLADDPNLFALAPPFNTVSGAAPQLLAGDRIALHVAKTLNQLFPPTGFAATTNQSTADRVQLNVGGLWTNFWLYDNAGTARWVAVGDDTFADVGSTVIPPGRGMFYDNRSAQPVSLLAYGEVREHDFVMPLASGNNLIGGGYPLDQSPRGSNSRQLNRADGFFGSRDHFTADTIFRWRKDLVSTAAGYETYFLAHNSVPFIERWVRQNDVSLTTRDFEFIFERDRSIFLRAKDPVSGYRIPVPWLADPAQQP